MPLNLEAATAGHPGPAVLFFIYVCQAITVIKFGDSVSPVYGNNYL